MLIRRAEIADIPHILRLLRQVCNVHQDIRPEIFRRDGVKYTENDLKALLLDENRPVWCAVEGETFLGYCFCQVKSYAQDPVMTEHSTLYIDDLCVDENTRGKGVGTALYETVCEYARARRCGSITLNVWCCNEKAMKFYEHLGLVPQKIGMEKIL